MTEFSMLHPQTRALLALVERGKVPPLETLSPTAARLQYRDRRHLLQPAPRAIAELAELRAEGPDGSIPMRLYRPHLRAADAPSPVLVYFHGGGFVIGDLDTHDSVCRELALLSGCAIVAVDYRLAPEHRFPAAVVDCAAATRWVRDQAGALSLDPTRLAVGGDSAGGTLAAVVAIDARERGDLAIAFQLLIYPVTDLHCDTPSYAENGRGYLLTEATMRWFVAQYLADPADADDWRASPLRHPNLTKLPPALVLTAGYDPLRDEGTAYAGRLASAGNRASSVCFPGQIHGFVTMGKLIDEASTALAVCAAELRRVLAAV
jgi:acetyl esterase